MADFKIDVILGGAQKAVSTVGEITAALKETRKEIQNVAVGSAEFERLTEQARKLQDEFKGVKEASNFDINLAQNIESVTRLGSSVASTFAIITSSIELFGGKSEEVSEAQKKAQLALSVAIGATTLATNAAKFAEDARRAGQLLSLGIQKALTFAAGEAAVATAAQAVATGTATTAQLALNAAMNANPIVLLISLLVAAGAAYLAFSDDTEEAKKQQEAMNKELEKQITNYQAIQSVIENFYSNEIKILKASGASKKEIFDAEIKESKRRYDAIIAQEKLQGAVTNETVKAKKDALTEQKILEIEFQKSVKEENKKATDELKKQIAERLKAEEAFQKGRNDLTLGLSDKLAQAIKAQKLAQATDEFEKLRINGEAELLELKSQSKKAVDEVTKRYEEYQKVAKLSGEKLIELNEQEEKEKKAITDTYILIGKATNEKYAADRLKLETDLTTSTIEEQKKRAEEQEKILLDLESKKLLIEAEGLTGIEKINAQGNIKTRDIELNALNDIKAIKEKFAGDPRVKDLEKEIIERKNAEIALAEKATADEITAYKIAKLQEYSNVAGQIANSILGIASAISEGEKIESENRLRATRDAAVEQTNALNTEYGNQVVALQQQKAQGLITEQQYSDAVKGLNVNLQKNTEAIQKKQRDAETKAKKEAFEQDKKFKIAQAIIAGAQGAVSAFTGAMSLGPIAGPIVGGILAAAVAATTAIQIANIRKTQFDAGAPPVIEPAIPDTTGAGANTATPAAMPIQAPSGGFTSFAPGLVGGPTAPTTGGNTSPASPGGPIKVVVLESDITSAQRRVSVAEANATF